MGCAASTAPGKSSDSHGRGAHGAPGTAQGDFLPYYTLAAVEGRDVFGPILKLQSYDPATGRYQLSALVVCTEDAQHRHHSKTTVSWWELPPGQEEVLPSSPSRKHPHLHPHLHLHLHLHRSGGGLAASQAGGEPQKSANGELLYSWREWRFWRFRFGTTCGKAPKLLRYQLGLLPGRSHTVVVPSRDEPWHIAFLSCNGLAEARDYCSSHGLYALWHDLMRRHETQPFHVMLGGGDQLYNDAVFEGPNLKGWDLAELKDYGGKAAVAFNDNMRVEVEEFYLSHYLVHWSRPAFVDALATIPSVNTWDDHDIVDGWGSYHELVNNAAVMQGVFGVSRLFYLLFQHHTTPDTLAADGYWCQPACCSLVYLGSQTALLVPDVRTCRTQAQVLPPDFLEEMKARLQALPPSVRHVVVMMAAPMLYPRLPVQEALQKLNDLATGDTLTSIIMQKSGLMGKVEKRFGMISVLDDLIDQWCSTQHSAERDLVLKALTDLAAAKGFRISLISGDVHCAGYAMMHSRRGVPLTKCANMAMPSAAQLATDPWFVPQIISSAILNVPPPCGLLKVLYRVGRFPEALLEGCVQRMVPLFGPESDYSSALSGRRNWCEITLGDEGDNVIYSWRCEKELGSEEVTVFTVKVPPLTLETETAVEEANVTPESSTMA